MSEWQPIESAPKDGTLVMLRRVHNGKAMFEGPGLFGVLHKDAPARAPLEPDPLERLGQLEEAEASVWDIWLEYLAEPRWLRQGRMHAFPEPTHWRPLE